MSDIVSVIGIEHRDSVWRDRWGFTWVWAWGDYTEDWVLMKRFPPTGDYLRQRTVDPIHGPFVRIGSKQEMRDMLRRLSQGV